MNERLKELIAQAGGVWSEDWECVMSGTLNLTRFAELIEKDAEKKYFSAGYIAGQSDGISETVQLTECELEILKGVVK